MTKVVEGTDVDFNENQAQPDVTIDGKVEEQPIAQPQHNSGTMEIFLREYMAHNMLKPEYVTNIPVLAQHAYFDKEMKIKFRKILKKTFFRLVSYQDEDLGYLMEHSDYTDSYPDTISLANQDTRNIFRHFGVKNLDIEDITNAITVQSKNRVVIPSLYELCLFTGEGDLYKTYLDHIKSERKVFLDCGDNNRACDPQQNLDIPRLRSFVEAGNHDIQKMVADVYNFKNDIKRRINGKSTKQQMGTFLHDRLLQYSPHLTV